MEFSMPARVGYSMVGADGKIKTGAVIDLFQTCSDYQSTTLGVGCDYLRRNHEAWVLTAWQIVFDERCALSDELTVSTAPYDFRSSIGKRNYWLKKGDRFCVRANSLWMLLNTDTMRPMSISADEAEKYGVSEPLDMDYAPRKIKLPDEMQTAGEEKVKRYQIDTNLHMNNAWYVYLACEYIPDGFDYRQLRVDYRSAAKLSDTLVVKTAGDDSNRYVAFYTPDGALYASTEFSK